MTGIDDHSRFCVSAYLMLRETAQRVCDGLAAAMRSDGVPEEILTDNGKVFTGRLNRPPVIVSIDRVCRKDGHDPSDSPRPVRRGSHGDSWSGSPQHGVRSSARNGSSQTLASAQRELDAWVDEYNHRRPHSSIGMVPPIERFTHRTSPARAPAATASAERTGDDWIGRRAGANGVISVSWQQICLGKAAAGHQVDVHVSDQVLQVWDGNQLLKTVPRTSRGEVRKNEPRPRAPRSNLEPKCERTGGACKSSIHRTRTSLQRGSDLRKQSGELESKSCTPLEQSGIPNLSKARQITLPRGTRPMKQTRTRPLRRSHPTT